MLFPLSLESHTFPDCVSRLPLQVFAASDSESIGGKWINGAFMKTEVKTWKFKHMLAYA